MKRDEVVLVPWSAERFKECLKSHANPEKIADLFGSCGPEASSSNPVKKAAYIKCVMDSFEKQFPEDIRVKTLEECGRRCITASTIKQAKRIKKASRNLQEFVDGLNKSHIGGGNLQLEGDKIHAFYSRCYCGSVSKTKDRFSPTYCNCSRGWYLELFEQALGKPVKVDLLESIVQGAKTCRFLIHT